MVYTHEIMKLRVFGNYLFESLLLKQFKKKEASLEFLFHFENDFVSFSIDSIVIICSEPVKNTNNNTNSFS